MMANIEHNDGDPCTEDNMSDCDINYELNDVLPSGSGGGRSNWLDIKNDVRSLRAKLWSISGQRTPNSFIFNHVVVDGLPCTKIYFMSTPLESRETRVFCICVPDNASPLSLPPATNSLQPQPQPIIYPWNLTLSCEAQRILSKEEQLLFERKRKKPTGISSYEFDKNSHRFLFSSGSQLFQAFDNETLQCPLPSVEIPSSNIGTKINPRINPEMCPSNSDLIAYVSNGNLWVINTASNTETQLTFVHTGVGDLSKDPISAGFPSYIIQEEFDRYKGFWWQPKSSTNSNDGIYRLLYEEIDESRVNIVRLFSQPDAEPEIYRFPQPGTPNAISSLKLLELSLDMNGQLNYTESRVSFPITKYFDWAEYLVRVGWTADGNFVWAQILNREQTRLELILFPIVTSESASPQPPFYVLYSERTDIWINVTDLLTFLPYTSGSNKIQFIWPTEESGFRHLAFIESELRPRILTNDSSTSIADVEPVSNFHLEPNVLRKVALTSGLWEIMDIGPLDVCFDKGLIFFHGLADSPIERHIYAVSYSHVVVDNNKTHHNNSFPTTLGATNNKIRRLTNLGSSYTATFSEDCSLVVFTYSNTSSPPNCTLFRIVVNGADVDGIALEPLTSFIKPMIRDPAFACPEISCHQILDGTYIYAMIYKPSNFSSDKKYPTVLNVYGGPHVQMVHNTFRGTEQYWIHLLASQGYCIINIDSRGSYHRGLDFEAHLKNRMGTVELQDQVEVLMKLADENSFIDRTRIGIFGWSYGGYLSLLGLLHYPQIFKVSVAGAPVCSWNLYDTGYTERYMDTPSNNPHGYESGSVLNYIEDFPDEENRLLIFQGLLDENVHFFHTAKLISALIHAGKPHQLQIYPTERHSLRTWEASEHFETNFLSFLQRCL